MQTNHCQFTARMPVYDVARDSLRSSFTEAAKPFFLVATSWSTQQNFLTLLVESNPQNSIPVVSQKPAALHWCWYLDMVPDKPPVESTKAATMLHDSYGVTFLENHISAIIPHIAVPRRSKVRVIGRRQFQSIDQVLRRIYPTVMQA